jgi:hypothetical protein
MAAIPAVEEIGRSGLLAACVCAGLRVCLAAPAPTIYSSTHYHDRFTGLSNIL